MLNYLTQHPRVPAMIAAGAAVVIILLNPTSLLSWLIGVLAAVWLIQAWLKTRS